MSNRESTKNWSKTQMVKELKESRVGTDRVAALKRSGILNKHGELSDTYRSPVRMIQKATVPIVRSKQFESWIVIGCSHVPFHNVSLMNKICQLAKDIKPDGFVIAGDFLDLMSLSSHIADSLELLRDVTLDSEYASANKLLDEISKSLPAGCKKKFLFGNHEDRYFREIEKGDNGKYGTALSSPVEALRLIERGYEVKTSWKDDFFKLGAHLEVAHGYYCTVHAAKRHLEAHQSSVMFAHTHRAQTYLSGRSGAFNIGTTCDIESPGFKYVTRAQRLMWTNAFGLVNIDKDGDFYAQVVQAHNGHFFANGKFY